MNNKICFDNNLFMFGMIGIIIFIYFSKSLENNKCPECKCPDCNCPNITPDKRYKPINDPLHPPTKKYTGLYDYIMPDFLKSRSSRGPLPQWQYIGNAKGDDLILQIFGRQTYHGSRKWEHYALHPHNNIKYSLDIDTELNTGHSITIREHDGVSFSFYENENDQDMYRYNPYHF